MCSFKVDKKYFYAQVAGSLLLAFIHRKTQLSGQSSWRPAFSTSNYTTLMVIAKRSSQLNAQR
jgi:hypothetical protein